MKIIYGFFAVFISLILISSYTVIGVQNPQELLVGKWKEVAWEYEKINRPGDEISTIDYDFQRHEICQDLLIHKAEIWEFTKDGDLALYNNQNIRENLRWNIKGRGHILVLKHENETTELYQIQEISKNTLVVHFSFDLQVRGIVKLTFNRIEE